MYGSEGDMDCRDDYRSRSKEGESSSIRYRGVYQAVVR
jgi:hypothetical protein